jgi:hypothetical protein
MKERKIRDEGMDDIRNEGKQKIITVLPKCF